jgi:RNA polymerase sigma-70 factor (ECF subfamily)
MTASTVTLDDNALIEMILGGQTEWFSVLMDRHLTAMRRCILALVQNPSDVDDLIQDAIIKVWLRLSTFRFEAKFRTWLLTVASNEALGLHRRRKCRPSLAATADLECFPSHCESPHQAFTRLEARVRVRTAIARLPWKYQHVLTLCDLEQLTAQEAARRMRASIAMVKTRLFRARRMLSVALTSIAELPGDAESSAIDEKSPLKSDGCASVLHRKQR